MLSNKSLALTVYSSVPTHWVFFSFCRNRRSRRCRESSLHHRNDVDASGRVALSRPGRGPEVPSESRRGEPEVLVREAAGKAQRRQIRTSRTRESSFYYSRGPGVRETKQVEQPQESERGRSTRSSTSHRNTESKPLPAEFVIRSIFSAHSFISPMNWH